MINITNMTELEIKKTFLNNINVDREVVFVALFGSNNYNLQRNADKDYKVFTMPSFDDLYNGEIISKASVSSQLDYDCKDVRSLSKLFYKANINWLEILVSEELWVNPKYKGFFDWLIENQEGICAMNLPYFYESVRGNIASKIKRYNRHFDSKDMHHALRLALVLRDFAVNDFKQFKNSIWYDDYTSDKFMLMMIKCSETLTDDQLSNINSIIEFILNKYEKVYKEKVVNEELNKQLENKIYELVKNSIDKS